MKQLLKRLLTFLHLSITRNQKYDAYTRKIIGQTLKPGSNCIDIGCHKGEILDLMIKGAPAGKKYGFEPIPGLYRELVEKYRDNPTVIIHPCALFDTEGNTTFQHVMNAPAFSGIKKRRYDGKNITIEQITVTTNLLDHVIPSGDPVDLIKIDVEGAEYHVMRGAEQTLARWKPVVIFEFGLGAADYYNAQPLQLFSFLSEKCGLRVSTLKGYLSGFPSLTRDELKDLYDRGKEYYFVAHP